MCDKKPCGKCGRPKDLSEFMSDLWSNRATTKKEFKLCMACRSTCNNSIKYCKSCKSRKSKKKFINEHGQESEYCIDCGYEDLSQKNKEFEPIQIDRTTLEYRMATRVW